MSSKKSTSYATSSDRAIIGVNRAPESAATRFVTVDDEFDQQRLDNFLLRLLKGVPKTHVYRIIRSGEVRVNKGRASADTRLAAGDVVRVPPLRLPEAPEPAFVPARSFPVLLEDEALLVINKPAGVAVHGGSGVNFGVIEQLRQARPDLPHLELVHRLDRDTSGALILAKKRSALRALQAQFRDRTTQKTYLALVQGEWPQAVRRIEKPLKRYALPGVGGQEGERRVKVTTSDDPDGQYALSLVRVRTRVAAYSLLEVTIKTGRTHQIRVHLASCGHPIVGDDKYGDTEGQAKARRMMLHAWRIGFHHPKSGEPVFVEATAPAEFEPAISPR
ncbi:ribosomal large subunit pseudouridine synthase C [Comamonas serinivorans]|uniref:Pseudouridine synthase n=1 Tax=Comamonas serinivorans TaxID=1082851 RepID=A0A1Y0ETA9_9BURK|nr:RluA family pseudouridine synthase [Comamonas serinivorans]ARU06907.1 ribosomal large subunit pseudouridine synthase C [Comamonas serinivorans]